MQACPDGLGRGLGAGSRGCRGLLPHWPLPLHLPDTWAVEYRQDLRASWSPSSRAGVLHTHTQGACHNPCQFPRQRRTRGQERRGRHVAQGPRLTRCWAWLQRWASAGEAARAFAVTPRSAASESVCRAHVPPTWMYYEPCGTSRQRERGLPVAQGGRRTPPSVHFMPGCQRGASHGSSPGRAPKHQAKGTLDGWVTARARAARLQDEPRAPRAKQHAALGSRHSPEPGPGVGLQGMTA